MAFYNSFNNSQKANDKKVNNKSEVPKERKRKDIEYIDIPIDKEIRKNGINMSYLHKKEKPVIQERALSYNDANKERAEKELKKDDLKNFKPYNPYSRNNSNEKTEDLSESLIPKLQLNSREIPPYPDNYSKNNRKLRRRSHDNKSKYNKQVKDVSPNVNETDLSARSKKMKINITELEQSEISSVTTSSSNSLYKDNDETEKYLSKENKPSVFESLKILSDSESIMSLKVGDKKAREMGTSKEQPKKNNEENINISVKNRNFIFDNNELSNFDIQNKISEKKKIKREFEGSTNSLDLINNNNIKYRFGIFNNNIQPSTDNDKEKKEKNENAIESTCSLFQSKENSLASLINQNETIIVDDPEIFRYGLDMRDVKNVSNLLFLL